LDAGTSPATGKEKNNVPKGAKALTSRYVLTVRRWTIKSMYFEQEKALDRLSLDQRVWMKRGADPMKTVLVSGSRWLVVRRHRSASRRLEHHPARTRLAVPYYREATARSAHASKWPLTMVKLRNASSESQLLEHSHYLNDRMAQASPRCTLEIQGTGAH